jgi:hypothetical protein
LREPSKRREAVMEETTGRRLAQDASRGLTRVLKHTLRDETVQVLVVGALNAQVPAANVVDGFIVDHEAAVRVLEGCVCGEDGVVWLDDGGCDLRSWIDTELELALLAVIDGQTLHQQGTETRAGTTAKGVEDQETLQSRAVVGDLSNFVQDLVNQLLSNGVMATGVVVGRVLLASDHLLGVEKTTVGTGADLVDNIGLEIAVDGAWHVFALTWRVC